jgi:hypothetical protein
MGNVEDLKMNYVNDDSGFGNEVLYRMCRERPLHDDMDTIQSKIVLIGRITGASLERGVRPGLRMSEVAQTISRSDLDQHIERLNALDRPTDDNLSVLLEAHQYLTDLLESITGVRKRVLASKYLHFHAPQAVFIFDSKADLMLRRQMPKRNHPIKFLGVYDKKFEAFALRCIYYRDHVLEPALGACATPRKIDMQLLSYGPGVQRVSSIDL